MVLRKQKSKHSSDDEQSRTIGKPKMTVRQRRWRLLLSYAPDWIMTIGFTGLFYLLDSVKGFRRNFSLTDTSIQYPHTLDERIPMWMLLILVVACPLAIMPCINLLTVRTLWDWHNSWLGLVLAFGLTGTLTNIVKITVGRPRPDMLARCLPAPGSANAAVFGLTNTSICTTTDDHELGEGFRSFFSGHSSLAAAGLGFLFYYLSGKLHLFDKRGHTVKAWVAAIPVTGAVLIGISRTMDYRHHWSDVFVGELVGFSISYFTYRQYFPSLESPLSHLPYAPRIPVEEEVEEMPSLGDKTVPDRPITIERSGSTSGRSTPRDERDEEGNVRRHAPELRQVWSEDAEHVSDSRHRHGIMA